MYVHVCTTIRINSKHRWTNEACTGTENMKYPTEGSMLKTSVAPFTPDISRVYVRCSRTNSMRAGVCNVVPRTAPTTKNWSARSEQSRVRSSKTWSSAHPASVPLRAAILETCSPTLYARRRWDGNELSATRLRDCSCNWKRLESRLEGGE
jgi:hypothetical protein